MADRDLRDQLASITGDDPSPEAVARMWDRLDAQLAASETPTGPDEDVMDVTSTLELSDAPPVWRRQRVYLAIAAAAVLAVVGLLIAQPWLSGDDSDTVIIGDDPTSTTVAETQPPPPAPDNEDAGPLERFLSIYLSEGATAAFDSGLISDDELDRPYVLGQSYREDFVRMDPSTGAQDNWELECAFRVNYEWCLIETDSGFPVLERDLLMYRASVDETGSLRFVQTYSNTGAVFRAYRRWLADNEPDRLEQSCFISWSCFNDPSVMRRFYASDDFTDRPTAVTIPLDPDQPAEPVDELGPGPLERFLTVLQSDGVQAALDTELISSGLLDEQADPVFTFDMLFASAEQDWRSGDLECRRTVDDEFCRLDFAGPFFEYTGVAERVRLGIEIEEENATAFIEPFWSAGPLRARYVTWLAENHPDRLADECLVDSGCSFDPELVAEFAASPSFD